MGGDADRQMVSDGQSGLSFLVFSRVFKLTLITASHVLVETGYFHCSNWGGRSGGERGADRWISDVSLLV